MEPSKCRPTSRPRVRAAKAYPAKTETEPGADDARFKRVIGPGRTVLVTLSAHYVRQHFSTHAHAEYLFGLISGGCHAVRCRGVETLATAGTVVTMNPGDVHSGGAFDGSGWRQHMVYIDEAALDALMEDILDRPASRPLLRDAFRQTSEFAQPFLSAYRALRSAADPLARDSALSRLVEGLLARYAGLRIEPVRSAPRAVRHMTEFIAANLSRPITLDILAGVGGLRRRQTIDLFRQTHGMAPHRYLVTVRIDAAKTMLQAGVPPAETALRSGFADQSHMTRHFRAIVGTTPGRYAAAIRPHA